MRALKNILLFLVIFIGLAWIKAEAATVAVLPLVNKVEFNTADEEKIPNMVYYNEALTIMRKKSGYMLIENDRLKHAIENNLKPYEIPTKEQLQTVCKKANVDILVGMILTNYGRKRLNKGAREVFLEMDVKAKLVSYNRLTGKYVVKKCEDTSPYDATLESRYDLVQQAWVKLVKREFNNLTGGNKAYR